MSRRTSIPFSVLDLAPVKQGGTINQSFRETLDLAQHAETWGYQRYWLAEHHNIPGIASAATSVLIGYVAGGTKIIRVGSGGVMLPNHAPLVIAEQFGTLESLYPGRIDLGLGRAPGTDQITMRALRRMQSNVDEEFPRDVAELQFYFSDAKPGQVIRAVPGAGTKVPIWLLGSSLYSAELAGLMGLPFAFASHFAPKLLLDALATYRESFRPSETLDQPYAMPCINAIVADTDAEAARLATSLQQAFLNIRRDTRTLLSPPVDEAPGTESEMRWVNNALRFSAIGSVEKVREWLEIFIDETKADEVMVTAQIFDHTARLRSLELLASARP
ncbi:MAG: LLM class flavin-dependent oxidoreductase [Pyrinomonadaceae bacterium]